MSSSNLLKKGLPYDAEIEYLESTGAYIVLPYGIDSATNMRVEFTIGTTNNDRFVFGSSDGWQVNMTMLGALDKYTLRHDNRLKTFPSFNAPFANKNLFIKDGLSYSVGTYSTTGSTFSKTIQKTFLFAGVDNGERTISPGNNVRIYSFYMSNGEYTVDLIPVRIGQIGYMYDKVSGQLFGNSGTGDFILGNDI